MTNFSFSKGKRKKQQGNSISTSRARESAKPKSDHAMLRSGSSKSFPSYQEQSTMVLRGAPQRQTLPGSPEMKRRARSGDRDCCLSPQGEVLGTERPTQGMEAALPCCLYYRPQPWHHLVCPAGLGGCYFRLNQLPAGSLEAIPPHRDQEEVAPLGVFHQ